MSSTDKKINYAVRAAKNIERKMIRDFLLRLFPFDDIKNYKYIGFGAKYFSDFYLFHKSLHIDEMISIEKFESSEEKLIFNKPFKSIEIKIGNSNNVLPALVYDKKFIAWLDYDSKMSEVITTDVAMLIDRLISGSVILLSYNSTPFNNAELNDEYGRKSGEQESYREMLIKKLSSQVPSELIPLDIEEKGLSNPKNYSKLLRRIIINQINKILNDKNAALSEEDRWICKQQLYFDYKDGAYMSTVGFLFFQKSDSEKYTKCSFNLLDFVRISDDAYKIDVPNLTIKEVRHLQECMPIDGGGVDRQALPKEIFTDDDINKFSKIYRYFPSFTDVEVC